ncbi:hypothetical protein [uncultured Erythrobacter sp.]|uniref:hypothetical protein n=1 Tax=uncultured Erythrobacter sp. TaxID=263913 RepID=UPI002604A038|nr:hypothetical protein [uncultured Erythrobacter sp.]
MGRSNTLFAGVALLGGASLAVAQDSRPIMNVWSTSEGEMELPVEPFVGAPFRARYDQDSGRIIGTFSYNEDGELQLVGNWIETSSSRNCDYPIDGSINWGTFVYTFKGNYSSFEGLYGWCDERPNAYWTGQHSRSKTDANAAPSSAAVKNLIERLKIERQRSGPRPAGSGPADYNDYDLSQLGDRLDELGIPDQDLQTLISQFFGEDGAFDPGKWDKFYDFAKRMRVTPSQRQAARSFERDLQDLLKLPDEAIEYLKGRFYQSDGLHDDIMNQVFGGSYQDFALNSLAKDPKLIELMGEDAKARLSELTDTSPKFPTVRARGADDTDLHPRDCSYNAVLERMNRADPSFAIKYRIHVLYGSALSTISGRQGGVGSAVTRTRLIAGVRDAIRQCERDRSKL